MGQFYVNIGCWLNSNNLSQAPLNGYITYNRFNFAANDAPALTSNYLLVLFVPLCACR